MNQLAQLKLTQFTKPNAVSAVQQRRTKLIQRLREQMQLAAAVASGAGHDFTRTRQIKDAATGERRTITQPKRVKAWWVANDAGKLTLSVRYGSKLLEFAKGKAGIEVAALDQLVPTLQLISDAVAAGELDAQIEAACAKLRAGFKR